MSPRHATQPGTAKLKKRAILQYLLFKKGPLTTTACDHGAFINTLGAQHSSGTANPVLPKMSFPQHPDLSRAMHKNFGTDDLAGSPQEEVSQTCR